MTMPSAGPVSPAVAPEMRAMLVAAVPALRAFAYLLTFDPARSDDLVQDTLVRAWTRADRFTRGGDLTARLFTILRTLFHAEQRRRGRAVADAEDLNEAHRASPPEQEVRVEFARLRAALDRLPDSQREALILVGAQGFTYAQAAAICGVAVGTVKSRVGRARARLAAELGLHARDDPGQAASGCAETEGSAGRGSGRPNR